MAADIVICPGPANHTGKVLIKPRLSLIADRLHIQLGDEPIVPAAQVWHMQEASLVAVLTEEAEPQLVMISAEAWAQQL